MWLFPPQATYEVLAASLNSVPMCGGGGTSCRYMCRRALCAPKRCGGLTDCILAHHSVQLSKGQGNPWVWHRKKICRYFLSNIPGSLTIPTDFAICMYTHPIFASRHLQRPTRGNALISRSYEHLLACTFCACNYPSPRGVELLLSNRNKMGFEKNYFLKQKSFSM